MERIRFVQGDGKEFPRGGYSQQRLSGLCLVRPVVRHTAACKAFQINVHQTVCTNANIYAYILTEKHKHALSMGENTKRMSTLRSACTENEEVAYSHAWEGALICLEDGPSQECKWDLEKHRWSFSYFSFYMRNTCVCAGGRTCALV